MHVVIWTRCKWVALIWIRPFGLKQNIICIAVALLRGGRVNTEAPDDQAHDHHKSAAIYRQLRYACDDMEKVQMGGPDMDKV
ncbi:hypothetical protein GUJ93_ZPchr0011g27226 [Zizania palustris]|uniref:Uncharacterized protein n=1 Tax=Zizania palustris TaxID=103762 RepID=A0A8J5WIJ9_ZIZPA|nr:hypothetical protein GUJ93_ZPchr0011g27226 [Zizania palustris]